MYSQSLHTTNIHPGDSLLINPYEDIKGLESYIKATAGVFDVIKNSMLENSEKNEGYVFFEPFTEEHSFFADNPINTLSSFWVSCATEQFLTPITTAYIPEKRLSTEIVKRYSLSKNVQKIYFSQVSFYVDVDVVMSVEVVDDTELDKFFDYEQQLLDAFDLPINFNYRPKESYFPHSESNVLIFNQ